MPDPRFPFSNFRPCVVVSDNITYPTREHAYQAYKTNNRSTRILFSQCITPGQAKRMGNKIQIRPDWEAVKENVMANIIIATYTLDNADGIQLRLYRGEIVEWNTWHDTFWGRCTCPTHQGIGQNRLGRLLMRRRRQLREQYRETRKS